MELEKPVGTPFRALIIAAHPDDIEFLAAGSVAQWTDAGCEVIYCVVTDGSAGSNEPDADLAQLVIKRQEEQRRAAAHVGVKDVIFLGYQDGTLMPTLELRRDLTRVIRKVRPHRVVIMDPTTVMLNEGKLDYINHPDHRAAGEAALYAVFPSAPTRPIFPELLAEGLEPHSIRELYCGLTQHPTLGVDITSQMERKIAALREHKSQLNDEIIDQAHQFDVMAGAQLGIQAAELFRVLRF